MESLYKYTIREAKVLGEQYLWLYGGDQCCGKVIFSKKSHNCWLIQTLILKQEHRGNNLIRRYFWPLIKDFLKEKGVIELKLDAKELSEKPNKLVNLYQDLGFQTVSSPSYRYDGEILYKMVPMRCQFT